MATIVIKISPDGTVLETDGVKGPSCEALLDPYVRALGGKKDDQKRKPDFYVTEQSQQSVQES